MIKSSKKYLLKNQQIAKSSKIGFDSYKLQTFSFTFINSQNL